MQQLIFATGNNNKFHSATVILGTIGITPVQVKLDIPEIQHEQAEAIVRDKAQKAYDIIKKPLAVTDDSWSIPGLQGFPGPYMKSINQWFSPEDFLRLTSTLADRRVMLHQYLVFQDGDTQKLFMSTITGTLQPEIRGTAPDEPSATVVSLSEDGRTIAEVRAEGKSAIAHHRTAWHELADWLQQQPVDKIAS